MTPLGTGVDNPASAPQVFGGRRREAPKGREVFELDQKLNQLLRDLRRALSDAISESPDVKRTLRKFREEGYALYLLVDCKREGAEEALALTAPRFGSASGEPVFQIDGRDLSFLRSIGIDPTRRLRRRRTTAT